MSWYVPTSSSSIPWTLRLRFHDLRGQAITELAEAGATDATMIALAGHYVHRNAGALLSRANGGEAGGSGQA
jgi:hypothetical protein